MGERHERLREKLETSAGPAEGEAREFNVGFRHPQSIGIVENSWKSAGRAAAIRPKPWRSVRSLLLQATSSSAVCSSSARAGRMITRMLPSEQEEELMIFSSDARAAFGLAAAADDCTAGAVPSASSAGCSPSPLCPPRPHHCDRQTTGRRGRAVTLR
jgi:hypothetical protein